MAIAIGFSRELARLTRIMAQDRVTLGYAGEEYAKLLVEAHGYLAEIRHEAKCGDMVVTDPDGVNIRVEVKTARLSKRKYFEFNLKKWRNGRMTTDCSKCDALLLLGVRPSGLVEFYVVPAFAVSAINVIKIPGKTTRFYSTWKQYRQYEGSLSFKAIVEANRGLSDSGVWSDVDFSAYRSGILGTQ